MFNSAFTTSVAIIGLALALSACAPGQFTRSPTPSPLYFGGMPVYTDEGYRLPYGNIETWRACRRGTIQCQ